jgi:hypothetical protein
MARGWRLPALQLAMLAAALALPREARSDVLIVSSSMAELKPGMQIADSTRLEVPAGAKVRVLLPSGATLTVNGPASRAVKEITKGEPVLESVWAKAKELLVTGGVDQSRPGAVRGISPVAPGPVEGPGFAWNVIGGAANGTVCVERGARLVLERPPGGRVNEVTLIDTAANARAKIAWSEGTARAEWPAEISPNAETTYQIVAAGQPLRQVKLRPIDKALTAEASAFRALLDNDCHQQARVWAARG